MILALFGLPSIHGIIEAIAGGFFGALAHALVPSFLTHAGVATIQALVALPDPASWPHVSQLQGEMTFLGVLLLPVTLAAGAVRYWLVGLTGGPSPVLVLGRAGWATGLLVAYRWLVEQTVAAANTLTHAILGFPAVSGGLTRIVTVLFGGALLVGAGGVFGALLVIIGVIFAAALFAAQVLVTLVLALLTVAGPPLIAVSVIPELSHLARAWARMLLAVALVPVGWTVLFATAGALALDASSFTGGAGGLPEHVAAAFAGLITFVLAVRLPIIAFSQARHLLLAGSGSGSHAGSASSPADAGVRVSAAQSRLRSLAFDAVPALGAGVGAAAGVLGAPTGGPLGALRRRLVRNQPRGAAAQDSISRHGGAPVRSRLREAAGALRDAPREARAAMRPPAERPRGTGRERDLAGAAPVFASDRARPRDHGRVSSTANHRLTLTRATARTPPQRESSTHTEGRDTTGSAAPRPRPSSSRASEPAAPAPSPRQPSVRSTQPLRSPDARGAGQRRRRKQRPKGSGG